MGPERLSRDDLLQYHDPDGRVRKATSAAQWLARRDEILRGTRSIMGTLPGAEKRCELAPRNEAPEVDCGNYVRRLISYAAEPGCRVPAYLLIPKRSLLGQKTPAMLCLHGTDDVVGSGTVVGLGDGPNRAYAAELADRGFVCLAPGYPLLAKYQPDVLALGWESGTLKAVWDNIRGLDYLQTLPYVDNSFGVIGHSLGGHNGVFTALFDDRLKVVVTSCGLDSFLDYYGGDPGVWQPERGWCQTRYMPKLAAFRGRLVEIPFDFHELVAALAPRDVLIIAPKDDHNFQASSVDRIAAAARPVFELYHHADRLVVVHPDGGHDFAWSAREQAYRLIADVLGPNTGRG